MAKYNEIMSRVRVTPEMRERVLANVETARAAGAEELTQDTDRQNNITDAAAFEKKRAERQTGTQRANGGRRTETLKRWFPLAAAACLVLVLGIGVSTVYKNNESTPNDAVTSAGLEDCVSLEELSEKVGFGVPDLSSDMPFEVRQTVYTNVFGAARVSWEGDGEQFVELNKAVDEGSDISGDNNEYAEEETFQAGGVIDVTTKGDHGTVSLATWTCDGYAYALSFGPAVDKDTAYKLALKACGK